MLSTLLKHYAVSKVLSEKDKASIDASVINSSTTSKDDLYALPPNELESSISSSEEESDAITDCTETNTDSSPTKHWNIHSIDMESSYFKSLPPDVRHEILTEMKETRKQSSWGRLHELPTQSNDFAVFQMNRLRKRRSVQVSLEQAEQEMGGRSLSLAELESLLNDQGVVTDNKPVGNRIASDENTRYLLIKDMKKAMDKAKQDQLSIQTIEEVEESQTETIDCHASNEEQPNTSVEVIKNQKHVTTKADLEYEDDLQKAIQLSLEGHSVLPENENASKPESFEPSFVENFKDADFESDSSVSDEPDNSNVLVPAKNYMMEYSGLTPKEIAKIIGQNAHRKKKCPPVSKINVVVEKVGDSSTDKLNKIPSVCVEEPTKKIHEEKNVPDSIDTALNTESDSSEDFIDVPETNHEEHKSEEPKQGLKVFVKPTENLEDDIFSDIFADRPEETNTTEPISKDAENKRASEMTSLASSKEPSMQVQNDEIDLNHASNEHVDDESENVVAKPEVPHSFSVEQLENLRADLSKEKTELMSKQATKDRLASNITDQMYHEAQVVNHL